MNFFFFFSLPLSSFAISKRYQGTYIYMYAFCSLFIGRREGGFLYPFTVQHDARKSSSPVTRTIFKEIYKLPDKLCLRVGSFSKFRRPSGPLSFPMSTNDVPGSSLASCNCQQTIFPFSIILVISFMKLVGKIYGYKMIKFFSQQI